MEIETGSLRIREFLASDQLALMRMHKDKRVRALLLDDFPLDEVGYSKAFIERQQELYQLYPGFGIWCAEKIVTAISKDDLEKHDIRGLPPELLQSLTQPKYKFAGWFNLLPLPDDLDEIELGSRLLPQYWGSGIAFSGGELLINYAFEEMGLQRLWIVCHIEHRSVSYIAFTLGFKFDGVRDYCGTRACYYLLEKNHWCDWRQLSLKDRKRYGVASFRSKMDSI